MDSISFKIARAIKNADPDHTSSIEVMQYALSIILNTLFIVTVSLVVGWLTGRYQETLITLAALVIMRMASGGRHLSEAWQCNIVSILLCVGVPIIAASISGNILLIMNMLSLSIMLMFAPSPDPSVHIPSKIFPYLKTLSVILVASNFLIGSAVIGFAFFVQSLTIIPFGRRDKP
ncbi:MAG TPA: accessory gene regulator B family protein [Paenibacillus sp.]|uniref:accessory gene regulator ArgB-like protein n=1 Tax=Paenibacillus sp. TaxID=58172 RepID=UPI0028D873B3|nr:accessory gene regulator B family protein [Paenibacillus sp.]HUC93002.1 accessory gene regulator B family protein [Paenibacillus sp.]